MTVSQPTAPNTMATSETRIETPAQRQPEGRYSPPDFEEAEHDPPVWLFVMAMCGSAFNWTVLEEQLRPHFQLYLDGLVEESFALAILCCLAYIIVFLISLGICMLTACVLVAFLWFWVDSWWE